jgi:hypothetical protein
MAELLISLMILTFVITTTIYMFTQRNQHLREANETILAYQVLANEAELWRRINFSELESRAPNFQTDTTLLSPLSPYTTTAKVDKPRTDVRQVTLTIRWNSGRRQAKLALIRVDTGGTNLW